MRPRRIAIVGGGIAGLTAAIALQRLGIATRIYERHLTATGGGGGLLLFSGALRALQSLGVFEELLKHATVVQRYLVCTWSGDVIWRLPLEQFAARFGDPPMILVSRKALASTLRSHLDSSHDHREAICSGFVPHKQGVHPAFLGGSVDSWDEGLFEGLLGADGFRSVIRRQLWGLEEGGKPRARAWGGKAFMAEASWPFGPGDAVTFLGGGQLLTAGTLSSGLNGSKASLEVLWFASETRSLSRRGFHARVASLLENTKEPFVVPIRDCHPFQPWGKGRVTLIGDAAHPMTPDVGQGAGQAIEDAFVLGQCLSRDSDIARAFRHYEQRRQRPTSRAVRFSRMFHLLSSMPTPEWSYKIGIGAASFLLLKGYCEFLSPNRPW